MKALLVPLMVVALLASSQAAPTNLRLTTGTNEPTDIKAELQQFREAIAHGKDALLMPDTPLSIMKASATPVEVSTQVKPSGRRSLLSSLQSAARKLLQSNWVGTDAPAFNAAAMNYYQGYPNRWRAGNAASSMWAAQNGDPSNFGAGYNPYMAQGRKLKSVGRKLLGKQSQDTWVGTDVPSFNGAAMNYYQGYPNRFRAENAASSMWAAQNGDPSNFGAGYNPYMAQGRKLQTSE